MSHLDSDAFLDCLLNYASAASGAGGKRPRHAAALKPAAMETVGFTVWIPSYVPDKRERTSRERERGRETWKGAGRTGGRECDEPLPFPHAGESLFQEEGEPREEAGGSFLEVQPRPLSTARSKRSASESRKLTLEKGGAVPSQQMPVFSATHDALRSSGGCSPWRGLPAGPRAVAAAISVFSS